MNIKPFIFAAFVIFIAAACSDAVSVPATSLDGKWELRTTHGGLSGQVVEYPEGNGTVIEFSGSRYRHLQGSVVTKEGTYRIAKVTSLLTGETADRILFDDEINAPDSHVVQTILLSGNELSIAIDAFDGSSQSYRRISGSVKKS